MPVGLANEGFGAEARWNVHLVAGHSYRLQVLVHDGDQNKTGGDVGQFCANVVIPSSRAGSPSGDSQLGRVVSDRRYV